MQTYESTTVSQFVIALKRCNSLERVKKVHKNAIILNLDTNNFVSSVLITMYRKCGSLHHARQVFDVMVEPDVVTWNTLILGYVEYGEHVEAFKLLYMMDCEPNSVTYVAMIKASGKCMRRLTNIHDRVRDSGLDSNLMIANTLIDAYCKSGDVKLARKVFSRMNSTDVVTWTSLISGYVKNGKSLVALELFTCMDCEPNSFTYVAALKACGGLAREEFDRLFCLQKVTDIHVKLKKLELDSVTIVATVLLDVYRRLSCMHHARKVFERMASRDSFSWNTLMLGYVENGESMVALELFQVMDCRPDTLTYVAVFKSLACKEKLSKEFSLAKGISLHKLAREDGLLQSEVVLGNSLIDIYSKCSSPVHATEVFQGMLTKDVVSWNTLILGYVDNGKSLLALELFRCMDREPDSVTYVGVIKACGSLARENCSERNHWLQQGTKLHKELRDRGVQSDIILENTLLDMYSKSGSMQRATEVFEAMVDRSVVTWTCLMLGYVENRDYRRALESFDRMDCVPDSFTYVVVLRACGALHCLEKGVDIHKQVKARGYESELLVASSLVDMYSKCGCMKVAREVFDGMASRDVVTWSSLVLGYVENQECSTAMELFTGMDCQPDSFTYVAAFKACGSLAAVGTGEELHASVCRSGLERDQLVANALMDFYGKCGELSRVEVIFSCMESPDIVSWNTLISGSLKNSSQVLRLVKDMQEAGVPMNEITGTSVLMACSHAGLVEEAERYFESMPGLGIRWSLEHCNCMVDLLGRANKLHQAVELVKRMPFRGDEVTWRSLLAACKKWKNLEVAKLALDLWNDAR